jgi:hypothetical protein
MKKLKKSRQHGNWPVGGGEDSEEKMENTCTDNVTTLKVLSSEI